MLGKRSTLPALGDTVRPLGAATCQRTATGVFGTPCKVSRTLAVCPGATRSSLGAALSLGPWSTGTAGRPATSPSAASLSMFTVAPPHVSLCGPAYWCSRW